MKSAAKRTAKPESTAHEFESQEERDTFLEARYRYDRKGYSSTLAYVGAEVDDLVRAFFEGWTGNDWDDPRPALLQFEAATFGAVLDVVPHGLLLGAVKGAMRHGVPAQRHAKVPPRKQGEGALDYCERICKANGWAVLPAAHIARPMPRPAPSDWSIAPGVE